jgi:hypothetical protein
MQIVLTGKEEELCEELRKKLGDKYSKAVVIRGLLKLNESLNKKQQGSEIIKVALELLKMVEENEWQTRNAAENAYCPYCANETNIYTDQAEHNKNCKFVKVVQKAKKVLQTERKV